MTLQGFGALTAHHGCLRFTMGLGLITFIGLVLLGITNMIPFLVAAMLIAIFSLLSLILAVNVIRFARSIPPTSAHARLLNDHARVIEELAPHGRVLIQGENWAATLDPAFADQRIPVGQLVRVIHVVDLRLIVTPSVETLVAQARALPPTSRQSK